MRERVKSGAPMIKANHSAQKAFQPSTRPSFLFLTDQWASRFFFQELECPTRVRNGRSQYRPIKDDIDPPRSRTTPSRSDSPRRNCVHEDSPLTCIEMTAIRMRVNFKCRYRKTEKSKVNRTANGLRARAKVLDSYPKPSFLFHH